VWKNVCSVSIIQLPRIQSGGGLGNKSLGFASLTCSSVDMQEEERIGCHFAASLDFETHEEAFLLPSFS